MFSVFSLFLLFIFVLTFLSCVFQKSIHAKQSNYLKKIFQKVPNQRFVRKYPLIWFFRGII